MRLDLNSESKNATGSGARRTGARVGCRLLGALVFSLVCFGAASVSAEGVRAKVEKWAEASRVASKESAEWRVEKETLRATRDLLKQQRAALKEEIEALSSSDAGASEERQALSAQSQSYEEKEKILAEQISGMEGEVRALVPSLPAPLVEKLEALLIQIPEDPATARAAASSRLMNVLGVLSQAEKFNSTASIVGETRAMGDGDRKVSVRTLYWGLGQAVYVDAEGQVAGFGRPGEEGWVFTEDPAITERAALLLDIYEGNTDAIEFINLPTEIR